MCLKSNVFSLKINLYLYILAINQRYSTGFDILYNGKRKPNYVILNHVDFRSQQQLDFSRLLRAHYIFVNNI